MLVDHYLLAQSRMTLVADCVRGRLVCMRRMVVRGRSLVRRAAGVVRYRAMDHGLVMAQAMLPAAMTDLVTSVLGGVVVSLTSALMDALMDAMVLRRRLSGRGRKHW